MDGLSVSALGAMAQSARVDRIAQNLANLATPGYRREHAAFRVGGGGPALDPAPGARTAGRLEVTGRSLDLALTTPGFFAVRPLAGGDDLYTRAGNFTLDAEGRLLTADGRYQVVDRGGNGVVLDPARGAVRVRPDGALLQGDAEVAGLAVVDFPGEAALRKEGGNLLAAAGAAPAADVRVEQGALEASSVDPITEMVEMIRALRALEANLQAIRFQDGALEKAVNEFGRMPR